MDWRREIMHYCVAIVVYLIFSNWPFFLLQLWSYFISNGNHFFCLLKFRTQTQTVSWTILNHTHWERLSKLKSKIKEWLSYLWTASWLNWNLKRVVIFVEGENRRTRRKTLRTGMRTNNKLNHIWRQFHLDLNLGSIGAIPALNVTRG